MKKLIIIFTLFFLLTNTSAQEIMTKTKVLLRGIGYELKYTEYFTKNVCIDKTVSIIAQNSYYRHIDDYFKIIEVKPDSMLNFLEYANNFFANNEKGTKLTYRDIELYVGDGIFSKTYNILKDEKYHNFMKSDLGYMKKALLKFIENSKQKQK